MADLTSIKQILTELKPELKWKYFVNSIGLFGSIVKAGFTEKSNVDIIVDFGKQVGVEFIDLANYIESKLRKKIDLVSKNGIKPKYFQQIKSEIVYI